MSIWKHQQTGELILGEVMPVYNGCYTFKWKKRANTEFSHFGKLVNRYDVFQEWDCFPWDYWAEYRRPR